MLSQAITIMDMVMARGRPSQDTTTPITPIMVMARERPMLRQAITIMDMAMARERLMLSQDITIMDMVMARGRPMLSQVITIMDMVMARERLSQDTTITMDMVMESNCSTNISSKLKWIHMMNTVKRNTHPNIEIKIYCYENKSLKIMFDVFTATHFVIR